MKQQVIRFTTSNQQDLKLITDDIPVDDVISILLELGFEHGEEQESDHVVYDQYHHDALGSITIKRRINLNEYELIKD